MNNFFIEGTYLLASILFVMGLKGMSHPDTARRGMHLAEFGMLMAIIGTLLHRDIVRYEWIIAGLLLGSTIGAAMGVWVPMTAMPQRTALSHAFGALAAALVGISEYWRHGAELHRFTMGAIGFEVLLGALTDTNYGRDHHPRCFTIWLAGGGTKPGLIVGETDDYSYNIVRDPIHVHDLQATILHCLGIDHTRLTYKFQGRYYRLTDVHGEVVRSILA